MGLGKIFQKSFTKIHVSIFRRTKGKRMNKFRGMDVLLLTTVGRKSGKIRTTPLLYVNYNGSYLITGSNGGSDKHPAWFYNLKANPQVEIELNGDKLQAHAEIAPKEEKEVLWPLFIKEGKFYESYQSKTTREIPVIKISPAKPLN